MKLRDPGGSASSADTRRPYDTKQRIRTSRGPRSIEAALEDRGVPFDIERFQGVAMRRALGTHPNKALHPQECYWRFSAFRYVVDEARKTSGLSMAELEPVLFPTLDTGGATIERYYLDVPGEPVASHEIVNSVARIAYLRGWLLYIDADWLFDEGAFATSLGIADLLMMSEEDSDARAALSETNAASWRKSFRLRAADARSRRLSFCQHAKEAHRCLLTLVERAHDSSGGRQVQRWRRECPPEIYALSALMLLEVDLTESDVTVQWDARDSSLTDLLEVDGELLEEPNLVFLRDVRRAIQCLAGRQCEFVAPFAPERLARSIDSLHVGISWPHVVDMCGPNSFFEEIRAAPFEIDEGTKWVPFEKALYGGASVGCEALPAETVEACSTSEVFVDASGRSRDVWRPVEK